MWVFKVISKNVLLPLPRICIIGTNKEATTKELKFLIKVLTESEETEELQLLKIESLLEEMKPIHCDINYQKYFPLLFNYG